jgi:hypothetical protein|nr:hypothetical protein [Williamsia marianensis]
MTDSFEHDTERVEPECREVRWWVLRKMLRFVKNLISALLCKLVYLTHNRSRPDHEREVLQSGSMP